MDFADEKFLRIAYHEAGHAWMMIEQGLGVVTVSMEPLSAVHGDNRGETVPGSAMEEGKRKLSEKFARAALAGSAVEHFFLGRWDEESLQSSAYDTGRAKSFMIMSGDDWKTQALDHYIQALSGKVLEEISRPRAWHAITGLAYELMQKGTMSGEEVKLFLDAKV